MKFLLQNYQKITDLIPVLQAELKQFYESDINEDELLESALIGNRPAYQPGHDGGTFTPSPGAKMTGIVQNRKVVVGVKAQVLREIVADIYKVGHCLRKIDIATRCLRGSDKVIVDALMAGHTSVRISDQLRYTTKKYQKCEQAVLGTVGAVSLISRKDYTRIKELLTEEK